MKKQSVFSIIVILVLIGCNPFSKDGVLDYELELNRIVNIVGEHHTDVLWFDSDDIPEMIKLDIDVIIKNLDRKNTKYLGFTEGNDSLLIFVKNSSSLFKSEKRIIYDFAKTPRNFGSEIISNASYEINQLNERWYFSIKGFD